MLDSSRNIIHNKHRKEVRLSLFYKKNRVRTRRKDRKFMKNRSVITYAGGGGAG